MSYTARPRNSPLATSRVAPHFAIFASSHFQLSSSVPQARFAGNSTARQHTLHSSLTHHPAHHRQALPPGIEEQPF